MRSQTTQTNILTKEGQKELEIELKKLIETERPKVIVEIKEAREQGDLSENTEFDAAREKQGVIEDRIKEIEKILATSQVLTAKNSSSVKKVRVGSTVKILDLQTKQTDTYIIVGSLEANPFEKKISNISPLAIAIFNAKENDIVTIDANEKYDVKIIAID